MAHIILGTCSLCAGPVSIPEAWHSTLPAVPTCQRCGAREKQPYGAVIEMEPRKRSPPDLRVSNTLTAAVIPDGAKDAVRRAEEYKAIIAEAWGGVKKQGER